MSEQIISITGKTEDEVWRQIDADFEKYGELFDYSALIDQDGRKTMLVIDIDPGGGFEGGYAFTTFSSPLTDGGDFKFAIHKEGLLDEVGKFFGMQDIETGYPEFDKKVIVKTNDADKVNAIFKKPEVREIFKDLSDYKLETTHHHNHETKNDDKFLELVIEDGSNDTTTLRKIYNAFYKVVSEIETT